MGFFHQSPNETEIQDNTSAAVNDTPVFQDNNAIFWFVFLVIAFFGVVCNLALMISVLRQNSLRKSPTYILLFSLSFADLCLLIVAVSYISKELFHLDALSQVWCRMMYFFVYCTSASSVSHLVAFSVFRYLILIRPFWARAHITQKSSVCVCMAIWAVSLISSSSVIFLTGFNNFTTLDNQTVTRCCINPKSAVTFLPTLIFGSAGSCGVMGGFHIAKTIKLRRNAHMIQAEKQTSSRQVSNRAVAAIVLTFLITWFPLVGLYFVVYLSGLKLPKPVYTLVWPILECLVFVNSAINPVLYFFFSWAKERSCFSCM